MSRDSRQANLIEAPSRSILDVVREGLIGLEYRQRDRDARRAIENEKQQKRKAARRKRGAVQKPLHLEQQELPNMQQIRVTWRAVVEQPIGKLNPSEITFPGLVSVEVYQSGSHWAVRSISAKATFEKLGKGHASANDARLTVEKNFRWMREPWQMWRAGIAGNAVMLAPGEAIELNGKWYLKEPEDFTHIMKSGPGINTDGNAKKFTAACDWDIASQCFISTKANVEPTCKTCAEIWRREYQGK